MASGLQHKYCCVVVASITATKKLYHGDCRCLDWQLLTMRLSQDIGVRIQPCWNLIARRMWWLCNMTMAELHSMSVPQKDLR